MPFSGAKHATNSRTPTSAGLESSAVAWCAELAAASACARIPDTAPGIASASELTIPAAGYSRPDVPWFACIFM